MTSTPSAGSSTCCATAGQAASVVDAKDIDYAVDNPPQSTRAKLRGDFVRAAKDAERDFTVDWVHLKLNDHAGPNRAVQGPVRERGSPGRGADREHLSRHCGSNPPFDKEFHRISV